MNSEDGEKYIKKHVNPTSVDTWPCQQPPNKRKLSWKQKMIPIGYNGINIQSLYYKSPHHLHKPKMNQLLDQS